MTENELIEKLGELKKTEPKDNWVVFCRANLIAAMASDPEPETEQKIGIFEVLRQMTFGQNLMRPAVVLTVLFLLFSGGGLVAISQANGSLPGEHLYPIKIALEQVRLLATPSAEGKAELQSQLLATRLDELNKVIKSDGTGAQKQAQIEAAVINLQQHLITVRDSLPKLDNSTPKKVAELAQKADTGATDAEKALVEAKDSLSPDMKQSLTEKINEATDAADKTSNQALEVIVGSKNDGGMTQDQIFAILDAKIKDTESKIQDLKSATENNSETGKSLPINASIILDADKAIVQAKASLENNDVNGALATIKVATAMVSSAQQLADSAAADAGISGSTATTGQAKDTNASTTQEVKPVSTSTSPVIDNNENSATTTPEVKGN